MEDPLLPASAPSADEEAAPFFEADVQSPPFSPPPPPLPTSTVLLRLASLAVLAVVSLWANYEASRGFGVAVLNGAAGTPAGRRFDLMFVSNGRASRAVLDASQAVERALYPGGAADSGAKKPVQHVTMRLADGNLSASVVVVPEENEFLLHVSSSVMLAADANMAMRAAVRLGMARVWLWDGQGAAPEALLDAMAEYLAASAASLNGAARPDPAGFGGAAAIVARRGEERLESLCWPAAARCRDAAVDFVRLCEAKSRGFVARLNRAMRGLWRPAMVEEALGSPSGRICSSQSTSAWGGKAASPVGGDRAGWTERTRHVTSQGWPSV